jgi:hypothetical protein
MPVNEVFLGILGYILNDFENSLGLFLVFLAYFSVFLSPSILDEIHILISHFNLKITEKIQTPHDGFIQKNTNIQIIKCGCSNVNPTLQIQQT